MLDAENVDAKDEEDVGLKFGGKYGVDADRLRSFWATTKGGGVRTASIITTLRQKNNSSNRNTKHLESARGSKFCSEPATLRTQISMMIKT